MKRLILLIFTLMTIATPAQKFFETTPASQQWVNKNFKKLSRKQKIAQLMVMRLSDHTGKDIYFFEDELSKEIKKYKIGSVCLFQGSSHQQAEVLNRLQVKSEIPLLVCIDGETGVGMRFSDVPVLPDQLTIGATSNPELAYQFGKAIGQQCKRIGIQVNYAPVVDINNNPDNPVINYRSFGEDKYKVTMLATLLMKGMQEEGVMACAKHFPGHGDVTVDSHLDLPVINKSMKALDSLELFPFKQMIRAGVGSMMIAHLFVPAIDTTKNQATTLSKKNITGLLKNKLGFKGLTFTDALEMKGVSNFYPAGQASAQSLIAGNDMLCLPGDIKGSIRKTRKAIRNHKLSWKDIDEKVQKVLLAKYNLGLNNLQLIEEDSLTEDLNKDIVSIKKDIYENAITLLRQNEKKMLPLATDTKVAYVGIGLAGPNHFARVLQQEYNADCYYFKGANENNQATTILNSLQNYDAIIIGIHQFKKFPADNFGLNQACVDLAKKIEQKKNVISFVFGNPYAVRNFSASQNLVACYEDDSLMHDVAINLLKGITIAKGKLPVTIDENFHFGAGITTENYFPIVAPKETGLDEIILKKIDSVANNAILKGATPGLVVLVARNGKVGFYKGYGHMNYEGNEPVTRQSVYDLASVTKTSATTMAVMKLYEDGKLDLNKTLGDYLPWTRGSNKAGLKLKNILLHQAGLVSYIPFYRETIDAATGKPKPGFYKTSPDKDFSIPVAANMYMRNDVTDTLYKRILQSKLGPADKYVYSDNDFILMGKIVEQITGQPLDEYVSNTFYLPMGMMSTTFKPLDHMPMSVIAPTEKEKSFRLQQIRGYVHDPGAAMFGGVAGHAGLFSNAYDLAKLYQMLLNEGTFNGERFLKQSTIDYFTAYQSDISRRGLGFDKPLKDNYTNKDPYPAKGVSLSTFGHTGFTGTCVWADPKYDLLYIFLSNRVCPDGENDILGKLNVRSDIQDLIYNAIIN